MLLRDFWLIIFVTMYMCLLCINYNCCNGNTDKGLKDFLCLVCVSGCRAAATYIWLTFVMTHSFFQYV
jgi:hypothetical protein